MTESEDRDRYIVPALERGLRLLRGFTRGAPAMSLGEIAKVIEAKGVAGQRRKQPALSRTVDIQVFVRVVVFRLDPRPRRLPQRIHIDIGYAQAGQMAASGRGHNLKGIALQADGAAIAERGVAAFKAHWICSQVNDGTGSVCRAADQASSHTGLAQVIWLFSWVTHR